MLSSQRIIFKDNSTLRDLSAKLGNYLSGTELLDIVAAQDALYIGSELPFNHRWFERSVANAIASTLSVSLWNGTEWKAAVDVKDLTANTSGASLAENGIVSWVPDKDESWMIEDSTEDISDLSTLKIYDMYWAKLTWSANLTGTTALAFVGHKFSSQEDLVSEYPELGDTNLMGAHTSGKTTWDQQAFAAAEYIIADLKNKSLIFSPNQILAWELFRLASIHKTAEIAFRGLGDNYRDNLIEANKAYKSAMDIKFPKVDLNANGRLEKGEKNVSTGYMTR